MNIRIIAAASVAPLVVFALTGCGTTPGVNSDVPNALYAGVSRPTPQAPASVSIVTEGPTDPAAYRFVSGVSCKNKVWDPSPSEENALAMMKQQAVQMGFDAVYDVEVKPDARALAMNCWAAIKATGKAFKMTAPAT